jgi:hypothetical protein
VGAGTGVTVNADDVAVNQSALKLDDWAAPDDNTDLNASTSAQGLSPKATAPASGLLNVLGIGNGETVRTDKAIFDTTNPAALGTAAPGTQVVAARRDHVHTLPKLDDLAAPDDNTDLDASTSGHGLLKKLPGGTTTYLRADGTFATPSVGGGTGGVFGSLLDYVAVVAASDESINNDTFQDDDELFAAVVSGGVYIIELGLIFTSGASNTPDAKIQFTFPSGTLTFHRFGYVVGATGTDNLTSIIRYQEASPTTSMANGVITSATVTGSPLWIRGVLRVGGSGGTLRLQWAQNTSTAGTPTVRKADSMLELKRVA